MSKKIKCILLDMDGVLVDFISGCERHFGFQYPKDGTADYNIAKSIGISASQLWSRLTAQFWADLPTYPWAKELVEMCKRYTQTYLCTTALNDDALAGKGCWMQLNLGLEVTEAIFIRSKWRLAKPHVLLVDDWNIQTDRFALEGGQTILFPAPHNSLHGSNGLEIVKQYLEANT